MSDKSDFDVPGELYEMTERHAKLKSEIRELIEEHREKVVGIHTTDYMQGKQDGVRAFAEELEEVLEDD